MAPTVWICSSDHNFYLSTSQTMNDDDHPLKCKFRTRHMPKSPPPSLIACQQLLVYCRQPWFQVDLLSSLCCWLCKTTPHICLVSTAPAARHWINCAVWWWQWFPCWRVLKVLLLVFVVWVWENCFHVFDRNPLPTYINGLLSRSSNLSEGTM